MASTNQNIMKRRTTDTKIKHHLNRIFIFVMTAVCLCSALCINASADEYNFSGAAMTEFYPSQSYESVYGAAYNYGGMNVTDFHYPELSYGMVSNTLIGSMEKAPIYERRLTYGSYNATMNYGIVSTGGTGIYEAAEAVPGVASVVQLAYQQEVYRQTAYTSASGMVRSDGSIGTVSIPSQGISMKVWEGETNESMAKGMGHYTSTSGWDGNVGVCGHNRGATYVIGSIKDLSIGDTITYETVYGTRTYAVSYVGVISNTDWSRLQPTADNQITITTCLAGQPDYRVCVQGTEI